jgi:hypothetical protein
VLARVRVKVLAPVSAAGHGDRQNATGQGLAPRPPRGSPLTVGLLDNIKPNGRLVLDAAYDALVAQGVAGIAVRRAKSAAGSGMSSGILDDLTGCDVVLTALAC